jgi:hypothetical protein
MGQGHEPGSLRSGLIRIGAHERAWRAVPLTAPRPGAHHWRCIFGQVEEVPMAVKKLFALGRAAPRPCLHVAGRRG